MINPKILTFSAFSLGESLASFFLLKGQYLFTLHFNEVETIVFVDRYNKFAVNIAALSHSNNSLVFISLSLLSTFYFHFCHLGTSGWCVDLVLICKHPVVHNLIKSHKTITPFEPLQ